MSLNGIEEFPYLLIIYNPFVPVWKKNAVPEEGLPDLRSFVFISRSQNIPEAKPGDQS